MDPAVHKRFLDYRERYQYFEHDCRSKGIAKLDMHAFEAADAEHRALAAKRDARTDEEEARFEELAAQLLRD
jgi:hypothetical protein